MKRLLKLLIITNLLVVVEVNGQDILDDIGYQSVMISNPAFAGSLGDGSLWLSHTTIFPGNGYDLYSSTISYDSYFEAIHGGASLFFSNDYSGRMMNVMYGGGGYSYWFQAGRDLYVRAGLSAALYHRGFNFRDAVLPDQIDPVAGTSSSSMETLDSKGKGNLDISSGVLLVTGSFYGGLSIAHLSKPNVATNDYAEERLSRSLNLCVGGSFPIGKGQLYNLLPVIEVTSQDDYFAAAAGLSAGNERFSVNGVMLYNNMSNIDLQVGFSISVAGVSALYNYCCNIASSNAAMPLSLSHQVGISVRLNNVKRNSIKIILFPKM